MSEDMPNPVVHFEIPADDVDAPKPFTSGGLKRRNMPGQPFANYVNVKSIDDFLGRIQAHGGSLVMPRQDIAPGMGSFAVLRDTEGNMMGLYQSAMPAAKKKAPARKAPRKAKQKRK